MNDVDVVAAQLGRPIRSSVDVIARCNLDLPIVIAVPPLLDDGTPFPTRYWLTCPLAVRRVGRIESVGGVKSAEELIAQNEELALRHEIATERYRSERDALLPSNYDGPRPSGGIGGARAGVKCLHAHLADHVAGNSNPIGELSASNVEPLNCQIPCVVGSGSEACRNPRWSEPRLRKSH